MENIHFIIKKHKRLEFKKSQTIVEDFIIKRLNFFGISNIDFVENNEIAGKISDSDLVKRYVVVLDILNPIVDIDLVKEMLESLKSTKANYAICDGAIPGTQVEYIIAPEISSLPDLMDDKEITLVRWFSQDIYNNQFNLYKYKRLKMFLTLLNKVPNLHTLSIKNLLDKLNEDEIFKNLVAYGEEVDVYSYDKCPHCEGRIIPLQMQMSQPFCGYLPVNKPLYHECEKCGLVVMTPFVDPDKTSKIYDLFDKEDFVATLNNPYTKDTPRCDFSDFLGKLPKVPRTLDLGGGMGMFSKYLKTTYSEWDVTHSDFEIKKNIDLENLNITTRSLNFIQESIGNSCYDLITAWEVLEHIPYENLESTLKNIYEGLSTGGIFMFSTPDFDSPLCKSNDFFAICPPFHYLVFSKRWLENYFENSNWEIHSIRYCSDFLDDSTMWYDYASKTAPSFQQRATSKILQELLKKEENKQLLLDKGIGTEIIFTLVKR